MRYTLGKWSGVCPRRKAEVKMEIHAEILKAILDAYPYEIVFCDRAHTVRFLNRAAQKRYAGVVHIGDSLFGCHNERARAKIEAFLARADAGEGEMFEALNTHKGEREFFVPVRDEGGKVIGYFERHEDLWTADDPQKPVVVLPL